MRRCWIAAIVSIGALLLVALKVWFSNINSTMQPTHIVSDGAASINWTAVGQELKFHKIHSPLTNSWKFQLYDGSTPVYFDRVLELLEFPNAHFAKQLTKQLAMVPLEAFLWECPPISFSTVAKIPFEFVVLPADGLVRKKSDPIAFSYQFENCDQHIVTFMNTGKDAQLVVPCPLPGESSGDDYMKYGHLATFLRAASEEHIGAFWRRVAAATRQRLDSYAGHIWLSTNGLGVQWLHMRLDSTPKYYNWEPYKVHVQE